MIRFLFRSLGVVWLAVAVLFAIIDATRSVGASALVLTSFETTWQAFAAGGPDAASAWISNNLHPGLAEGVLRPILAAPSALVFAALALIFYLVGRKPRHVFGKPD